MKSSKQHQPPEFRFGANSARAAQVQQRRRSNAAGPHVDRRFKGTRGARQRFAVSANRKEG